MRLAPADPTWPGLDAAGAARRSPATSTRRPRAAAPDERAARVRAFVDAAGGLETAGYCRTVARPGCVRQLGRPARDGGRRRGGDGRHRADRDVRRAGPARRRRGSPTSTARCSARGRPRRRGPAPTRSSCRRAATRWCWSRPRSPTCCRRWRSTASTRRRSPNGSRSLELGAAQFDPAVTLVDDAAAAGRDRRCRSTRRARRGSGVRAGRRGRVQRRGARPPDRGAGRHDLDRARDRRRRQLRGRAAPACGCCRAPAGRPPAEVDGPAADSAVAALVAGVERGLLVTDIWYTRVLDPRTLVVTGLTRNGVWLIEDGEVTTPVRNFRFTQSYPQALGARRGARRRTARGRAAGRPGRSPVWSLRRCGWPPGITPAARLGEGDHQAGCGAARNVCTDHRSVHRPVQGASPSRPRRPGLGQPRARGPAPRSARKRCGRTGGGCSRCGVPRSRGLRGLRPVRVIMNKYYWADAEHYLTPLYSPCLTKSCVEGSSHFLGRRSRSCRRGCHRR